MIKAIVTVADLGPTMGKFYARSLDMGRKPDGGAMPLNDKGEPLGRGSGTIARNWTTSSPVGDKTSASISTAPYQEGGHFYAVRSMVERGASPVGSEGKAGALIDAIVSEHADRAVR